MVLQGWKIFFWDVLSKVLDVRPKKRHFQNNFKEGYKQYQKIQEKSTETTEKAGKSLLI